MAEIYCARCGKELREGTLKYMVHVQILSDFDGVMPYSEEDLSQEMHMLLQQVEDMDAQELEDDVYQELSFVLCEKCKKAFASDPFYNKKTSPLYNKKLENLVH
jgi:hypothetical protein